MSQEFVALSCLQHDYIVRFYGITTLPNAQTCVILEYCENNTLESLIRGNCLPTEIFKLLYKIASGLTYCHSKNIVHLNLSPKNILLDKYFNPKLAGFGRDLDEGVYVEPDAADARADVWSFGCVAWSVLTQTLLTDSGQIDLDRLEG